MLKFLAACSSLLYIVYKYYVSKSTPIKLFFVHTDENLAKLEKCPSLFKSATTGPKYVEHGDGSLTTNAKYISPFWLLSVHAHTIWAAKVRKFLDLPYKREILISEDGGTISIDWFESLSGSSFAPNTPTVIILHGLTGGSYEPYVQHLAHYAMVNAGMRAVVINYRGCANTQVTSGRTYCAANTEDFRTGLAHIQKKIPSAPLFAAGFSLGSIILVKYLSEVGEECPFIAAASLSNPMDLNTSSLNLIDSAVSNFIYNRALSSNLKNMFVKWVEFWQGSTDIDIAHVMASKTIRDVDERLTAKLWGYKSVEDYYYAAAPLNHIQKVKTKLLCVNCVDDPLTYVHSVIPHFLKNPNIILALVQWGGHLGFLEGWGYQKSWADRAVVDFFKSHMN